MTRCIIKHKEGLGKAICLAHKDIDHAIDLGNEFLCIEESIMILPWLEHNAGLTKGLSIESMIRNLKKHPSGVIAQASPLIVKKSKTINDCLSPFGLGAGQLF